MKRTKEISWFLLKRSTSPIINYSKWRTKGHSTTPITWMLTIRDGDVHGELPKHFCPVQKNTFLFNSCSINTLKSSFCWRHWRKNNICQKSKLKLSIQRNGLQKNWIADGLSLLLHLWHCGTSKYPILYFSSTNIWNMPMPLNLYLTRLLTSKNSYKSSRPTFIKPLLWLMTPTLHFLLLDTPLLTQKQSNFCLQTLIFRAIGNIEMWGFIRSLSIWKDFQRKDNKRNELSIRNNKLCTRCIKSCSSRPNHGWYVSSTHDYL